MLSIASRRYIKQSEAEYDAKIKTLKEALVVKPTEFWESIVYALEEYRKHVHGAWITNTLLETKIGETYVEFVISSNLVDQNNPKPIVEYRYQKLTVPHLIRQVSDETITSVRKEIVGINDSHIHPMTLFWWAGTKWLFDKGWVPIVFTYDKQFNEVTAQFLSPARDESISIITDYVAVEEDSKWLKENKTEKDATQ